MILLNLFHAKKNEWGVLVCLQKHFYRCQWNFESCNYLWTNFQFLCIYNLWNNLNRERAVYCIQQNFTFFLWTEIPQRSSLRPPRSCRHY